ncbi:MAG: acryloyl-CoA reductase, partial [Proteobacteria bacterium]|nr:acryloyl-CoA reductase [Pseudomonadota bacterium]
MSFRAFRVEKNDSGFVRCVTQRDVEDLPDGEVLIDVQYSSLNYKDALSATGNPGVTRVFPHTPGIDAAGLVVASSDAAFAEGDAVVVIGFDLGMSTSGGFAERIRVPANWVVKLPAGLSARESMRIGTAGFTAAECVQKLEQAGMTPTSGPVLVTGATGGVGSVAVKLLATLGYEVAAVTGKPQQHDFLRGLGATEFLTREEAAVGADKPMLAERWGGVVDTVGGDILFNGVKSLRYGCSLAACGLVAAPQFSASVLPFILRHVNLLGVDSVQLPIAEKTALWSRLATTWKMDLTDLEEVLS